MGFALFVVYMIIGALLCGLYIYLSSGLRSIDHSFDILVAVLTGAGFPIIAPFSISIILVKRMLENKK